MVEEIPAVVVLTPALYIAEQLAFAICMRSPGPHKVAWTVQYDSRYYCLVFLEFVGIHHCWPVSQDLAVDQRAKAIAPLANNP